MPRAPNSHISFDADDPEDCKRAISELRTVILKLYGAVGFHRNADGLRCRVHRGR
jgi:hypothetical protein